jgi:glycosyltransferase involved in cell wall biosynthesis
VTADSARRTAAPPPLVLAGAAPGDAAGNAVSTEVMLAALEPLGPVGVLSHALAALPRYARRNGSGGARVTLGTQPLFSIHAEALLPGWVHRRRLSEWHCGWVVNSRYAGALVAAGVPYALWEATTVRDELAATDPQATRRAGLGSGLGARLHHLMAPAGERLERLIYRRATRLFAMSAYTRDHMIAAHGLPPDAVDVLAHPPTPAFLAALERERERARPRLREAPARLLFVGRAADPRKNFELLLAALARLRGAGIATSLTVVGPCTSDWQRRAARDARAPVTFLGRVDTGALAAAYLSHDLLVVPSRQEGFGIVVAEALHAGMPVVSTRCGGPEATVRESGAGLLADHTPAAFADAVAALLSDASRRAAMGRSAARYASTELSFQRFAARVAGATDELARRARPGARRR